MPRSSGGDIAGAIVLSIIALILAAWVQSTFSPPGGNLLILIVAFFGLVTIAAAIRESR